MSSLMDGISNVNSITAQINSLNSKELIEEGLQDPQMIKYTLEKNFNQMLNDLLSTSNDDEDEDESSDPFSFLLNSNQAYVDNLIKPKASDEASLNLVSGLNDSSYLDSLYALQDNALALQSYLDLSTSLPI